MNGQSLSKQARIDYIDLLRAFGILVMIMDHIAFGHFFYRWVHIFHMPMFFVISGYFYKPQSIGRLLKKRAKTLLLPYIVFGLLHCIIHFVQVRHVELKVFYLLFWENTAGDGIPIAGALWFLTAMFFSDVIYNFLSMVKTTEFAKTTICFAIAIFGMLSATFLPFRLPLAMDVGMVGVGFYQTGKLLKERGTIVFELKWYYSLIGVIVFSILGIMNGDVNLRLGEYQNWILFWINATGLTISLWNLARIIHESLKRNTVVANWLRGIGQDSIVYLCLNQLAILIASTVISFVLPAGHGLILLARQVSILCLTLIELYGTQRMILCTPLKAIVGK